MDRARMTAVIAAMAVSAVGLAGAAAAAVSAAPPAPGGEGAADPAVAYLMSKYSLAESEAKRRIDRQERVEQLVSAVQGSAPDVFSGLSVSHAADGRVVVRATREDGRLREAARRFGLDEDVSFETVARTEAALSAVFDDVAAGAGSVQEDENPLAVSVSVARNAVAVHRAPGRDFTAAQATWFERVQARHGEAVFLGADREPVQARGCSWPSCDPPLRGGIWINPANTNSGGTCTSGFYVASKTDSKPFMLTAAHCGGIGSSWYAKQPRYGTWHAIGPIHNRYWNSNGDAAIVRIDNPAGWSPQGIFVQLASSTAYGSTTVNSGVSVYAVGNVYGGLVVCETGATYGTSCGEVLDVNTAITYSGVYTGGVFSMDKATCWGDSGGPVFSGNTGYGIIVAGPDNFTRTAPSGHTADCGYMSYGHHLSNATANLNVYAVRGP